MADWSSVGDAFFSGYDRAARRKEHKEGLAYRMARAKAEDKLHAGQLANQQDQERLRYGEQGLNLDELNAGASEADSAAMADQALGPGTAEAAGIGRMDLRGTAAAKMDAFTNRMTRKQAAGTSDVEAQAELRRAQAADVRRGGRRAGRATAQQLAAAKIAITPLQKKLAMSLPLNADEQSLYDSAMETISSVGTFDYQPTPGPAPKPAEPTWGEKLSGLFRRGAAAPAAQPPDAKAAARKRLGLK